MIQGNNMELEKEFKQYALAHKVFIITCGFICISDDIFNSILFSKYKNVPHDTVEEVNKLVEDLLLNHEEEFEILYGMCWDKLKDVIVDDRTFNR